MTLPEVRTATYVPLARSVACWSGIGQSHDAETALHVIDADRRRVRQVAVAAEPAPPPGRGGAVAALLSPHEAIVLCGSDHSDGDDVPAPYVLKLVLPPHVDSAAGDAAAPPAKQKAAKSKANGKRKQGEHGSVTDILDSDDDVPEAVSASDTDEDSDDDDPVGELSAQQAARDPLGHRPADLRRGRLGGGG